MVTLKTLNESLSRLYENLSIEQAVEDELSHERYDLGYDESEISQLGILENVLENYDDLDSDDRDWLEKTMGKPSISDGEKSAIIKIFRSIGEWDIPFDLGEDDFE